MNKVISIAQYKEKQQEKTYIKHYGNTPVEVTRVKRRPHLTLVQPQAQVEEKGSIHEDAILASLLEELEKEGISKEEVHIIKPNPDIPW